KLVIYQVNRKDIPHSLVVEPVDFGGNQATRQGNLLGQPNEVADVVYLDSQNDRQLIGGDDAAEVAWCVGDFHEADVALNKRLHFGKLQVSRSFVVSRAVTGARDTRGDGEVIHG